MVESTSSERNVSSAPENERAHVLSRCFRDRRTEQPRRATSAFKGTLVSLDATWRSKRPARKLETLLRDDSEQSSDGRIALGGLSCGVPIKG